eukprot:765794-Hanusia_phi.AAC.4
MRRGRGGEGSEEREGEGMRLLVRPVWVSHVMPEVQDLLELGIVLSVDEVVVPSLFPLPHQRLPTVPVIQQTVPGMSHSPSAAGSFSPRCRCCWGGRRRLCSR